MDTFAERGEMRVTAVPLTAQAFTSFGDVLDDAASPDYVINDGACARYHDRARLEVDSAGRLGISVFVSRCYTLPLTVDTLERHPLGSQAFIPLSREPYLVVVAPDEGDRPGPVQAFVASSGQGVNLHKGIWHGVLTPLGNDGHFAVVDRIDARPGPDGVAYARPSTAKDEAP